ncbi:MAG: cupin domain-containing protein [Leptolyngbyaceae bacterium]|nr:cupin domain-containing protein [Leptolyngbyaceae bacterium]
MKYVELSQISPTRVSHNAAIQKQVMLQPGDISNLVYFSQARFQPGQIAPGHSHSDMSEVFFVESGTGTITIDGKVHSLGAGTCVGVQPGEVHEISNTGTMELVLTYFGIQIS